MGTRAIAIGAVVAAAFAFVVAGLAAGTTSARHPALRLLKTAPVHLRGTSFRPGERVRIVGRAGQFTARQRVLASSRGSFAAALKLAPSHCSGLLVTATGNAGSRATLKRPPLPACQSQ